jgi:hypothetical protein
MKKLKIQFASGSLNKILNLSKITKLLASAKKKNSLSKTISFQSAFLSDQNKLIDSMTERIKVEKCEKNVKLYKLI